MTSGWTARMASRASITYQGIGHQVPPRHFAMKALEAERLASISHLMPRTLTGRRAAAQQKPPRRMSPRTAGSQEEAGFLAHFFAAAASPRAAIITTIFDMDARRFWLRACFTINEISACQFTSAFTSPRCHTDVISHCSMPRRQPRGRARFTPKLADISPRCEVAAHDDAMGHRHSPQPTPPDDILSDLHVILMDAC